MTPSLHTPLRTAAALATALAVWAAPGTALAETSPYYVGLAQTLQHSDNLLRLADGESSPSGYARSDTVSSTALLVGLDQTWGRQRLFGTGTWRDNRYRHNDLFNNRSFNVEAGVDWATVHRLSGTVRASANRSLARFNTDEFGLLTKPNTENTRLLDAVARLGVTTVWTLEAGFRRESLDYSATEYASRNLRQDQWTAGVKFNPSSDLRLGLGLRSGRGENPDYLLQADGSRLADEFQRRDVDLSLAWTASAASTLETRLSRTRIDHEKATDRSFHRTTGLLRWRWQPSGKLRLNTEIARDTGLDNYFLLGSAQSQSVDYSRISSTLRLRADWAATAKLGAYLQTAYTRRELENTLPAFTGLAAQTGEDRTARWALGLTWSPLRPLQLSCELSHEQRRSDDRLSRGYTDPAGFCSLQFVLQ
ncbi:MAG: hypothetical protein ACK5QH_17730 [Rubrivivax sp.]|jgi:hypothetical protein